jgi:hypothetical protein
MFKNFIITLLVSCQALAALPPTSLKGQNDSAASTKFFFQVPNYQATSLGGPTSLIETGNTNLLANPGFEATTVASGWTVAGVGALDSTNYFSGKKALSIAVTALTGEVLSQAVTPGSTMQGSNLEAAIRVKTASSNVQVCSVSGATEIQCVDVSNNNLWQNYSANMPAPSSGSITLKVKTTSSTTGTILVDDGYLGVPRNITSLSVASDLGSQTWTTTQTNSTTTVALTRVGSYVKVVGKTAFTGVSTGATDITIPSAYTPDATTYPSPGSTNNYHVGNAWFDDTGVTIQYGDVDFYAASTLRIVAENAASTYLGPVNTSSTIPFTWGSGDVINWKAEWKVSGWSATQQGVSSDQTNYDWASYTPTFTNSVSTPVLCEHKRDAADLLLRCGFTVTSTSAGEARVSLPGTLTTADSSKITTLEIVGSWGDTSAENSGWVLAEASKGYVTFSQINQGSVGGLVKRNGSSVWSNGTTVHFTARVPIAGWLENGKAPILIGGVTSSTTGSERIERASVTSTCSSTPCTINSGTPAISSITRASTGLYTVNFAAGTFSANPSCTCSTSVSTFNSICAINSNSTSAVTVNTANQQASGAQIDVAFSLICMGPR